jgi:nucleotide-binding universal stress UspA family protein
MAHTALHCIVHPTDFSETSLGAFAHALRIAVAAKGSLHLLHIGSRDEGLDWTRFPHVRQTLARWGMLDEGALQSAVAPELGVHITKASIRAHNPVEGVVSYVGSHRSDLLVLMTHARQGMQHWFHDSIAEASSRQAHVPTLFLREGQTGFVNSDSGNVSLQTILLPVDVGVPCLAAWRWLVDFGGLIEPTVRIHVLHVGTETASFPADILPLLDLREGDVVETILSVAKEVGADLIAMPTVGRHGLLDALQGSTTERVLHHADCPVLAIPAL